MREVVETLVLDSKEDRGEDLELRVAEGEEPCESRSREPFSGSSRRSFSSSCCRGDIVVAGSGLRAVGDFQRSRKKDVVAD